MRKMKLTGLLAMAAIALLMLPLQALAWGPCSIQVLAGRWVFATDVGRFDDLDPALLTTAIGTMNIAKDGNMVGVFDVTVQNDGFVPDIAYWGTVTVNRDCRGTVTFTTGDDGSQRTDSLVVVSPFEILAMSQDPKNLWTYQIRRISVW